MTAHMSKGLEQQEVEKLHQEIKKTFERYVRSIQTKTSTLGPTRFQRQMSTLNSKLSHVGKSSSKSLAERKHFCKKKAFYGTTIEQVHID